MDTVLIITIVTINSLSFFGFGYWIGQKDRREVTKTITKNEEGTITKEEIQEKYIAARKESGYPEDGIFAEPSGAILRPTAKELEKMNEDQAVKESKEAMADTFRQEPQI